jgi:hypothetical protein
MKANPKTEALFDREHNNTLLSGSVRQLVGRAIGTKTFISLPFTGGISAFAVILPTPLGEDFTHPWS